MEKKGLSRMADAKARIYLYPAHQTGLLESIKNGFRCPLKWDDETRSNSFNACTLEFKPDQEFRAGESFSSGIWFLSRQSLDDKLRVGARFKLWSSGFIGEGEVTEVLLGQTEERKDFLDDDKRQLY